MVQQITIQTFEQIEALLNQFSDQQYSLKLEILNGSSIGGHIRHILEFYNCLMTGAEMGEIDYNKRERNMNIEKFTNVAMAHLDRAKQWTSCTNCIGATTSLISSFGNVDVVTPTCLTRELVYLIEHNIHHFAIIAIAVRNEFPHVNIPQDFGVAHSTIQHRAQYAHAVA